uniref:4-coumarate--CoA ligase n=1 Tax=Panagrolaimus superbus TaxID=310955 RepID=A0A914Z8M1_9BILA
MPYKSSFPPIPIETQPFGERFLDAFWRHSVTNPTKKAMICAENPKYFVTYQNLYLHSLSVSAFLESKGFGHGDIAALVLPNSWEFLEIIVGAALRGGGVSGASVLFTDFELQRQFIDSKAKIVFCADNSLDRVIKAAKNCKNIHTIVVVQVSDRSLPEPELPFGIISYTSVISTLPTLNHHLIEVDVHRDILLLPYSSGTTGSPKGVMINHSNFSTMISIFTDHYDKYVFPKIAPDWDYFKEPVLLSLPFYHIYGIGILFAAMLKGQTGIVPSHFDKTVYLRSIQDYKIRFVYLVPPILVLLANDPIVDKFDLSSLQFALTGAAPAGVDICEKAYKRLKSLKRIDQAYGMTECSMACTMPVPDSEKSRVDVVGKLLSNFEMKVIDPSGRELGVGEIGELCIRSPTIMMGYLGRPQATAEAIDDDGWYHTGDVAKVDNEGYIYVVDRLKELIKVKGYQVAPAELEDLLLSHHDVADAAVVGIPNEAAGEIPKAFIVRKNSNLTEQQIHEFVNAKTAAYKHLKGGIEFISEIPKSPAGKILRRFLRDQSSKSKL